MNFLSICFLFILTIFIQFIGDSYLLQDLVSPQVNVYSSDNGSSFKSRLTSKTSKYHIEKNMASFPSISYLELYLAQRLLVVFFGYGHVLLCSTNNKGLRKMDGIRDKIWLGVYDVVCVVVGT